MKRYKIKLLKSLNLTLTNQYQFKQGQVSVELSHKYQVNLFILKLFKNLVKI